MVIGYVLENSPYQGCSTGAVIDGSTHLDIVDIEDAVVALVLVPPVRQAVAVLVGVDAVHQ